MAQSTGLRLFLCSWICVQVCKYFLDAVEKKQYGWFWVCPNGGKDCHYRHALPPGYVLKSQMKALLEEESEKITIEEEIENQVIHVSLDPLVTQCSILAMTCALLESLFIRLTTNELYLPFQ